MTEQLLRLFCLPLAASLFLFAAQISGGLVQRDAPQSEMAMR